MLPGRADGLVVGPLGPDELRGVLQRFVPAISRPELRRIHASSGGNPLHAIELTRALLAGDEAAGASLAAAVAQRLERLPPDLHPLLEAAAALGRPTADALAAALPDDGGAALDAAVARGVLAVGGGDELHFEHPLVQSVVYERMTPAHRRALHGRLARLTGDPDDRARHLARSAATPEPALAAEIAAAAERASGRSAYDLAAEFAGHALRLTPADDVDAVCERGLAEIRALGAAGEWTRGLAAADALVARLPRGPGRARAIMERAYFEDDDFETGERWLEQALDEAGDDPALRARVLDWLGWARGMHRGALRDGIAAAEDAVRSAEKCADPAVRVPCARTLAHMRFAAGLAGPDELRRVLAHEIQLEIPPLDAGPRATYAELLFWDGDLAGSRAVVDEVRDEAIAAHDEHARAYWLYDLAMLDVASGELGAARGHIAEAIEAARDARDSWGEALLQHALALTLAWQGDADRASAVAGERLARAARRAERPWIARLEHVLGLLALSRGEAAAAAERLAAADDLVEDMGFGHPAVFRVLPDAVEALAAVGDLGEARRRLARLERQAARSHSRYVDAATARARGVVAAAAGDGAAAADLLEESAAAFEALGFRPDAARARLELGGALLAAGSRGRAAEEFAAAHDAFRGWGPRWAARAAAALERVAPGRARGELTDVERAIVDLVAAGRRNREIAGELYMSVSSVEAHLTRVYRKLGVRSRTELARLPASSRRGEARR